MSLCLSAAPIISQLPILQAKNHFRKSVTNLYLKFSVKTLSENHLPRFCWPFSKFPLSPPSKPTGNFRSLHIILYRGQTLPIPGMVPRKERRFEMTKHYFLQKEDEKGWVLREDGGGRAIFTVPTKQQALVRVQGMSQDRSVKIRNSRNGTILEERTYPRKVDPKRSIG